MWQCHNNRWLKDTQQLLTINILKGYNMEMSVIFMISSNL